MLPEYIIRMQEESAQLNERLSKAIDFYNKETIQPDKLNPTQLAYLDEQINAMSLYAKILSKRIQYECVHQETGD